MSVNKIILLGNLGNDPKLHEPDRGKPVCTFNLATNHCYFDSKQQRHVDVEWHQVVCFGPLAMSCGKHLTKGRQVYLEGRLETQKWDDSDGEVRESHRIIANRVQFMGARKKDDGAVGDEPILETSVVEVPEILEVPQSYSKCCRSVERISRPD